MCGHMCYKSEKFSLSPDGIAKINIKEFYSVGLKVNVSKDWAFQNSER